MRAVCLFCGSRTGHDPAYRKMAGRVGRSLAEAGFHLIYGAGDLGLMGEAARAAQAAGGHITGVIPRQLADREVGKQDLDKLIVTETMHERKKLMLGNADAVVALPGGLGTLDEVIEALTWRHLGFHAKPILLFDQGGYWDPLMHLFKHFETEGFVGADYRDHLIFADTPAAMVGALGDALSWRQTSRE